MIGVFEHLPDDIIEKIFKIVHKNNIHKIQKFLTKYVPDPFIVPNRFINYENGPNFLKLTARLYSLNSCQGVIFHNKKTKLESIFVYNLIHNN